ncbi:MAG: undecaprenyl-diphosphatase UppP [Candidatus Abawacabacteria bacterium]|nr:undecaprenyl-diphosphatase UppP [Candidatus Abawacabacteria bacterium]
MLSFILLGIIQGLTEFLPISSSGHLILARDILGFVTPYPLAVDAILQLGTIGAVYIYFAPELWQLLKSFFQGKRTLGWAILVGTIPALLIGLIAEEYIDLYLRSAWVVSMVLIVGALLFLLTEKFFSQGKDRIEQITIKSGLITGIAQCLAFIPGFSRSGATIMAGMTQGLSREAAARFSFYLSLPIITLSGLKKLYDLSQIGLPQGIGLELTIGTIIAFIVGLACIHLLLSYLKNHSLAIFAWYRIILAMLCLFMLISR